MSEQPRPDANSDEQAYSLTVEEAAQRYETAGHARTLRAIQKYCARGDLDAQKEETSYGHRYRITPASVARHIAQIIEVSQTHGRVRTRTFANVRPDASETFLQPEHDPSVREQPRPDANGEHDTSRYVTQLESENQFLRSEITTKNRQIADASERARETNILIKGLHHLVLQLQAPHAANTPTTESTTVREPAA